MSHPAEDLEVVHVDDLARKLGFAQGLELSRASRAKALTEWRMETDDAPILRYLFRHFRPQRHLEFGTWQGDGALCCLEECDATVWTINLPEGELGAGGPVYATSMPEEVPPGVTRRPSKVVQTDSGSWIGWRYRERGLGHRVCQILADSRAWDVSPFPRGFFDSALIDGGHDAAVVHSDTIKALHLLRPGGLCLWHDFCPHPEVLASCASTFGVAQAIVENWHLIRRTTDQLFWIEPSWLLAGIRNDDALPADLVEALRSRSRTEASSAPRRPGRASSQAVVQKDAPVDVSSPPDAHSMRIAARCLYRQRPRVVSHVDRLRTLCQAVGRQNDLTFPQWCHLFALALELEPDCILELGRGYGNSTCVFTEAAQVIPGCTVTSVCRSRDWWTHTLPKLRPLLGPDWAKPLDAQVVDLADADFERPLQRAQRVLVFWDAHGFDVAEVILGRLMPLLADKTHLVVLHDVSDARYSAPSPHPYDSRPIWRGQDPALDGETARLRIGWIDTCVDQTVAVVDFLSRNGVELQSADRDVFEDLVRHPQHIHAIESAYPRDGFARVNHWAYFSLSDTPRPLVFPPFVRRRSTFAQRASARITRKLNLDRALDRAASVLGRLTGDS